MTHFEYISINNHLDKEQSRSYWQIKYLVNKNLKYYLGKEKNSLQKIGVKTMINTDKFERKIWEMLKVSVFLMHLVSISLSWRLNVQKNVPNDSKLNMSALKSRSLQLIGCKKSHLNGRVVKIEDFSLSSNFRYFHFGPRDNSLFTKFVGSQNWGLSHTRALAHTHKHLFIHSHTVHWSRI